MQDGRDENGALELEPAPLLSLSTIELIHELGLIDPIELARVAERKAKPHKLRQSAYDREQAINIADEALAILSAQELACGPKARREIETRKGFQASYGVEKDRKRVTNQRLGQRKALLRLMQVEFHADVISEMSSRTMIYLGHMLEISANVAALSGSRWKAHATWFRRRLPVLFALVGEARLKVDFDRYLAKAAASLASRVHYGHADYMTGCTVQTIAETLHITTAQLRFAKANRCGLTSIDPETKRDRDRKGAETRRRGGDKPMVPQNERTKTADRQALADRLGCGLSTIKRHERKGDLDAFITSRGG